MSKIKSVEELVLAVLKRNMRARTDDFVLYGSVLKEIGVNLKETNLYDFLASAKEKGVPSFETCTRCRRKLFEQYPELIDVVTQEARDLNRENFIEYSKSWRV